MLIKAVPRIRGSLGLRTEWKSMPIYEWFDPYNVEHMKGWMQFQRIGQWPQAMWDNEVSQLDLPKNWQTKMGKKVSEAWMKHLLEGKTP
jgi:hypothetical protein